MYLLYHVIRECVKCDVTLFMLLTHHDAAVKMWHAHLHVCAKAKGRHIEHNLS